VRQQDFDRATRFLDALVADAQCYRVILFTADQLIEFDSKRKTAMTIALCWSPV